MFRELLEIVEVAVKNKKKQHSDTFELARTKNRPMILIDAGNDNEQDPSKLDKGSVLKAHTSIPDALKMHLSMGRIVEDVFHAHSYIIDYNDSDVKALFNDDEWRELTNDRIGIPTIPDEIAKELTDIPSLASANRKNHGWVGAIEAAKEYLGVSDNKYLLEYFKMPKTLYDMLSDLIKAVNPDEKKANKLQVFGILHFGLRVQFVRMWLKCLFKNY
ncbi:2492_t:CDS:2 [Entrophospora sp. SA101]|nr:2492_t:CDS:2 [Entrophospora sp. SA101]